MPDAHRLVIDTNILVRGLINPRSTSGRILLACERRAVILLLSREVLKEYRGILRHPALLARYPQLIRPEIDTSLERLLYLGEFLRHVSATFAFPRDPKDAAFLRLAIAGRATHLISVDEDMIALRTGRDDAAKRLRQRLPQLSIMRPEEYVRSTLHVFAGI